MSKWDLPFILRYAAFSDPKGARGFNVAIVDHKTGSVEFIGNFDSYISSTACSSLQTFLAGVKPGDIVMAALTDAAFAGTPSSCTTLNSYPTGQACVAAFQQLGSTVLAGVHFWQPWAFIGVAGSPGAVLAEGIGAGSCGAGAPPYGDVSISTVTSLDYDGDGIIDANDTDNDNDSVPNVIEQLNGTDILDPASF